MVQAGLGKSCLTCQRGQSALCPNGFIENDLSVLLQEGWGHFSLPRGIIPSLGIERQAPSPRKGRGRPGRVRDRKRPRSPSWKGLGHPPNREAMPRLASGGTPRDQARAEIPSAALGASTTPPSPLLNEEHRTCPFAVIQGPI